MEVLFTRSATRHRIPRANSAWVVEKAARRFRVDRTDVHGLDDGRRYLFVGDDQDGCSLEVIAVSVGENRWLVIHAMKLRDKYRLEYEEEKRWRST